MTHQSIVPDVLTDCTPNADTLRDEVLAGLSRPRKKLMPKRDAFVKTPSFFGVAGHLVRVYNEGMETSISSSQGGR